jgi:2-polyprenyl-6-methoxyphenol hydroxylase-like FAD-dependent oxidoreductase
LENLVIVVGAGPAGLMTACELRLADVDVVVLDPRRALAERNSPGTTVHGRTLEILEYRGLDQPDAVPRSSVTFAGFRLGTGDAQPRDRVFDLPQPRFEQILEERA